VRLGPDSADAPKPFSPEHPEHNDYCYECGRPLPVKGVLF
jgi:hypothetical protein